MTALKLIRRKKMIAQGGRCYYCGLAMWDNVTATTSKATGKEPAPRMLRCTAEHLQARSDGGGNTADNIVAACWYCNSQRHRRPRPRSPEEHRLHVRRRMGAGKWLAALVHSGSLHVRRSAPEMTKALSAPPDGARDMAMGTTVA